MNDPTLTLLAQLDDPDQYVRYEAVPVFKAHKRPARKNAAGEVVREEYEVTEADLEEIAQRCRQLEEQGVLGRITLGHTLPDPDRPEADQPPPVGWAKNRRVGTFGPAGEVALLEDQFIRRDRVGDARSYPYRSAEYYRGRGEITGTALLRRDPELDLGIMTYVRGEQPCYYAMESPMDPTMPPTADPTADPAADPGDPDFDAKADRYMARCYPNLRMMHDGYQAAPSGTNGAMPAPAPPPGPDLMRRAEQPVQYARLEAENRTLRQRLEAVEKARAVEAARALVAGWQADGYVVRDPAKEVERLARLDEAGRADRDAEVRENYARDPSAGDMLPVVRGTPGREGEFTQAHLERAEQYMRQHPGCDWEDARAFAVGGVNGHALNGHKK